MKIEIWSDFVCPFCYIGKKHLELALEKFESDEPIEIIYKSFELNPQAKKKYENNIHEIIADKYGLTVAQAKSSNDRIVAQAKSIGLNYNFDDLKPTNTFDAHRLSHFAKANGKMAEFTERVLKAYFVDSLVISDHVTLADLAEEVGLSREKALEVLVSDQYSDEVRRDEQDAVARRITGVPYFVFDDSYEISGAQPPEVFTKVLNNKTKK